MQFQNSKGFWEKLNSNLESVKYAEPHLHYQSNVLRREWRNLSEEVSERHWNSETLELSRAASEMGVLKSSMDELAFLF